MKRSIDVRKMILQMAHRANGGHIGSSLSMVEIIYALYFRVLNVNPLKADAINRDRLILSAAQGALALYAIMQARGFFPKSWLEDFLKEGRPLTTFPNTHTIPGVEMSGGSLGQGLSFGVGLGLRAKKYHLPYHVFVIMGDGELNEGAIWEAALAASHYKLDNLIAIINRNGFQIDGETKDVMELEPLGEKWRAFGWHVSEVNGHDVTGLTRILRKRRQKACNKPSVIIANTVKGKGISFMENSLEWHAGIPDATALRKAVEELEAGYRKATFPVKRNAKVS